MNRYEHVAAANREAPDWRTQRKFRIRSEDRIFLRRHLAAYSQLGDAVAARRATIRVAVAFGISQTSVCRHFGVSRYTVEQAINGPREAISELAKARQAIARAERALKVWRGRERAALERIERYGYQTSRD